MTNDIVEVIVSPLEIRDDKRFGRKVFEDRGFRVRYLDISQLLYPEAFSSESQEHVIKIVSYQALEAFLAESKTSFFILLFGNSSKIYPVLKLLSDYDIYYGAVCINAIPTPRNRNFIDKVYYFKHRISFFGLLKKVVSKVKQRFSRPLKPARFVLLGGKKSEESMFQYHPHITQKVFSHTLDYDIYLENRKITKKEDFIVFIDDYVPFHPDWKRLGLDNRHLADHYFEQLNHFFDLLEKETGQKVVIAAHPRANYTKDYWKGRRVCHGTSQTLISEASACIMHASTALSYVVLYEKPIMFITMPRIEGLMGPLIKCFAEEMETMPVDITILSSNIVEHFFYDQKVYSRYKEHYIKTATSDDKPHWEICSDFFIKVIEEYETKINEE